MGQVLARAIPSHDMEKCASKQLRQGYWQCLRPPADPRRARQDWLPGYKGSMHTFYSRTLPCANSFSSPTSSLHRRRHTARMANGLCLSQLRRACHCLSRLWMPLGNLFLFFFPNLTPFHSTPRSCAGIRTL